MSLLLGACRDLGLTKFRFWADVRFSGEGFQAIFGKRWPRSEADPARRGLAACTIPNYLSLVLCMRQALALPKPLGSTRKAPERGEFGIFPNPPQEKQTKITTKIENSPKSKVDQNQRLTKIRIVTKSKLDQRSKFDQGKKLPQIEIWQKLEILAQNRNWTKI